MNLSSFLFVFILEISLSLSSEKRHIRKFKSFNCGPDVSDDYMDL